MDLHNCFHATMPESFCDISIRHPIVAGLTEGVAGQDGHALQKARKEKVDRYPAKAGYKVTPLLITTFGKMGTEYKAWLTQLAAATNNKEKQRGWQPTRNKVGAWMTQISWYIANSVATTVEASADMAEVPREDDKEAWEQWHDVRNQARARMQEEEEEEDQCMTPRQRDEDKENAKACGRVRSSKRRRINAKFARHRMPCKPQRLDGNTTMDIHRAKKRKSAMKMRKR